MKTPRFSPLSWILFGFFGYPIVSFINEILGWIIFSPLLGQLKSWPDFGFGGPPALIFGPPLGILTGIIVHLLQNQNHVLARIVAIVGGVAIAIALFSLVPPNVYTYTGDFGFVSTPLIWCAALILFGCLARNKNVT